MKLRLRCRRKTFIPIIVLLYLLFSEYLSQFIEIFRYADEMVMILFSTILFVKYMHKDKVENVTYKSFVIILVLILLGLIANLFSGIQSSSIAIALDIISNFKMFICFYGIYETVKREYDAQYILNFFCPIAKAFLFVGTICGLLSLFMDLGMRGQERFGIYGFNFIYDYAHIYSITILICIMTIVHCEGKATVSYIFMAIIQMVLTTKGPSIMWAVGILILLYYMRYHKKIGAFALAGVGILGLILGSYQLQNYLLNESAPRYLFYKYGIVTALNYFPFGSGFATFGSDMAAKYYSPLYVEYGFSHNWGMSANNTQFLRDNYWPMIMGQFDFWGLLLFIVLFYMIFQMIQKSELKGMDKAMLLASFIYLIVHSIGSSTPTTSVAITMMMFIALVLRSSCKEKKENAQLRYK